jgi:hypothetical protein
MRSITTIVAAAFLLTVPGQAQKKLTKAFAVAPDVAVRIHNLVGLTRVTGWDRDSIAVVATIPPGGGSFFGGGGGRFAKMGIEGQDPSLSGPASELDVRVPRGARVWVKSGSARVELTNVGGEVEVSTITGPVQLEGSPRVTTLETIDGDVTIRGAATVIRIRTGAGAVRVTGARGDLSVSTVQGPVIIDSDQLLSARIESVSGRVEVRSGVAIDGLLDVQTHDGNVQLILPVTIDARFDLSTVKGVLASTLVGQPPIPKTERSARFTIGKKAGVGRGAGITVRTFSGSVTIGSPDQ